MTAKKLECQDCLMAEKLCIECLWLELFYEHVSKCILCQAGTECRKHDMLMSIDLVQFYIDKGDY